ncbi:MAG: hypothetical protein GX222_07420 [Ruminococcaceae bacterium]|nr:hypothetical protein [Oscillospiraceae bacterium]
MTDTLEMRLGIISVKDAVDKYFKYYPDDILTKLKITHKGPFYKYSFIGNDGKNRHSLKLNAQTGDTIKSKTRILKRKDRSPARRDGKKINLENMISFSEINTIALDAVPASTPIRWKLKRKKIRTLWELEITDERGANMYKVNLDAQNGKLLQFKLKT